MKSVIRGAGYVLAHTPDMVLHNGTTQTTERIVNPDSEYLKELPSHIRSFEQAVPIGPIRSTSATRPRMNWRQWPSPGATRSATATSGTASSAR